MNVIADRLIQARRTLKRAIEDGEPKDRIETYRRNLAEIEATYAASRIPGESAINADLEKEETDR